METFPSKNISIAWVEKGSLTRNLFLSFGFAILTALSAQIRFELPFTPVPITAPVSYTHLTLPTNDLV